MNTEYNSLVSESDEQRKVIESIKLQKVPNNLENFEDFKNNLDKTEIVENKHEETINISGSLLED